ncbi:MAG: hypothetical protein DRQ39_01025 [Gammaproteobacteria bacterium]|nr:MAG: hypothetical protein DRQ39_01025 [Gammaproteobacteria bacterium]RKZ95720.1 MAG: hypothetical protein DRQ46_08035 [Gammaproteobacteria bacterium]RKZ96163.1 MAG: hypothetical protein DRQ40_01790 [Gammaproteobacteria bacterium]RKZ99223.1 MAG: hypothetical protein DRQ42_08155 [Gammaproteobacteria bacterium]
MIKNFIIVVLFLSLSVGGYLVNGTINTLKSTITALHIKHKKNILKTKIKERGKRVLTAIPIAGLIAIGWFEKLEYEEWKQDNPDGTPEQYANEVADLVYEIAESYYQEILEENSSNSALENNTRDKLPQQTDPNSPTLE